MIETKNLTKKFGTLTAVDNISLSIKDGEWCIFVGPNGAGKTTTIKMLLGIVDPSSGSGNIAGYDIRKDRLKIKKIVGYLSEQFYPYPYLTGYEYLRFIADVYGFSRKEQKKRVDDLLELFEFESEAQRLLKEYSQGMKKKMGLCAALLPQPKVLILDEPTSELDPKATSLIRKVIRGLCDKGVTTLMSTHILGISEKMCDNVIIINHGKLIRQATLTDLQSEFNGMDLENIFLQVTGQLSEEKIQNFLETQNR
jgi:ABC-2 type transport system ATP-binding protein